MKTFDAEIIETTTTTRRVSVDAADEQEAREKIGRGDYALVIGPNVVEREAVEYTVVEIEEAASSPHITQILWAMREPVTVDDEDDGDTRGRVFRDNEDY